MTSNPVALITGGSSGIGAATAHVLLARGRSVAVTGRSRQRLEAFAERCMNPTDLITLPGDTSEPATVQNWVEQVIARFGRLDAAIANAGYAVDGGLADGDPRHWPAMVATNVLGPALLTHHAAPALRTTRGRLVLVGSAQDWSLPSPTCTAPRSTG